MPKRILWMFVPYPIKRALKRQEAQKKLYGLVQCIYATTDEAMILNIDFHSSDHLLSRAYLIIHELERIGSEELYPFLKTEVFNFLVILKHRLEDNLAEKNPHPLTKSYLRTVRETLDKIKFIMMSDDVILPRKEFFSDNSQHWQHS